MSPPEVVFHRVRVSPAPTARRDPSHVKVEQRRGSERYEPTERQRHETEGSRLERGEELADWVQTLNSPSREVVTAMRSEGWKTREVTGLLHRSRGAGEIRTRKDKKQWLQETEVGRNSCQQSSRTGYGIKGIHVLGAAKEPPWSGVIP
jgi:DNA-directed RNA polymerase specialized sigma24 family protein